MYLFCEDQWSTNTHFISENYETLELGEGFEIKSYSPL